MAHNKFLLYLIIFCSLLLSSCTAQPGTINSAEGQDVDYSHPYQKVMLWDDESTPAPKYVESIKQELKKNLMYYNGVSEEVADHMIETGKIVSKKVEAGNTISKNDFKWGYVASAHVNVWESEGYFAVVSVDNPQFVPHTGTNGNITLDGKPWADAEEGILKPHPETEIINIAIGITGELKEDNKILVPSESYRETVKLVY